MLYALHYEKYTNNDINGLLNLLKTRGVPERHIKVNNNKYSFICKHDVLVITKLLILNYVSACI